MKNMQSSLIIQDPLAIFHNRSEVEETSNYFKYLFFTDIPALAKSHGITLTDFAESVSAFLIPTTSYKSSCFPFISPFLYGNSSTTHYCRAKELHLYEHCLIRALHTVQYLRYRLSPASNTLTESQLKYRRFLLPDAVSTYVPGYFERRRLLQDPKKFRNLQSDSSDASSYAFWSKQFSKDRADLTNYFLFSLGRLDYQNEVRIPVVFPEYNLKYYNHIQNNQNRIWQGINSAAFKNASPKLPNSRLENIVMLIRNICSLPVAFDYNAWNEEMSDVDNEIWIDNILVQYQCERYFNSHMIKHIVDCKPEALPFKGTDLWLSFLSLPNIFTRKLLADAAFDTYNTEGMYSSDIYEPLNMDTLNTGMSYLNISDHFPVRNKADSDAIWLDVVFNANRYLSNVFFPFYEKLLFLLVYYLCSEEDQLSFDQYEIVLEQMESCLFRLCCETRSTIDDDFYTENRHINKNAYDVTDTPEHRHMYLEAMNALFNNNSLDLQDYFHTRYDYRYFKIHPHKNSDCFKSPSIPDMYHSLIAKYIYRLLTLETQDH